MPLCEIHGEIYKQGGMCNSCSRQNYLDWKESHKKAQQQKKKYTQALNRKLSPNHDREKAKALLQFHWRKKIFPYYEKLGLTRYCWINPSHRFHPEMKGRLYSAQVSHYYAKSHIYQLWTDPVNSGICCYHCNVDKPEIVAAMEPMIIETWGQQRFDDMKGRMEMYLDRINKGIDRKYPTLEWFHGMILETKKMVIK